MKKISYLVFLVFLVVACNEGADVRGIPGPAEVEAVVPEPVDLETEIAALEEEGFEVSLYEIEDQEYIRQKYFLVLLKEGPNWDKEASTNLEKEHQAYLEQLAEEDYVSLAGPAGAGETRGILVFNTPDLETAEELAERDPLVRAGKLEFEIYPWWVTKGGKLK